MRSLVKNHGMGMDASTVPNFDHVVVPQQETGKRWETLTEEMFEALVPQSTVSPANWIEFSSSKMVDGLVERVFEKEPSNNKRARVRVRACMVYL